MSDNGWGWVLGKSGKGQRVEPYTGPRCEHGVGGSHRLDLVGTSRTAWCEGPVVIPDKE